MLLIIWNLAAVPVLCNRLKINVMLLMTIYLINKFSILVLDSILMANNVVFVLLIKFVYNIPYRRARLAQQLHRLSARANKGILHTIIN